MVEGLGLQGVWGATLRLEGGAWLGSVFFVGAALYVVALVWMGVVGGVGGTKDGGDDDAREDDESGSL